MSVNQLLGERDGLRINDAPANGEFPVHMSHIRYRLSNTDLLLPQFMESDQFRSDGLRERDSL